MSNCVLDNDSVDDNREQQQQLLCRPVGSYPLEQAEKNALNISSNAIIDPFSSTVVLPTKNCGNHDDDDDVDDDNESPAAASMTLSYSSSTTRGGTNTKTTRRDAEIPIKKKQNNKGIPTKSDSSRRWQNRRKNARTIAKKARFRLFAEWLIETYGKAFLTTCSSTATATTSSTSFSGATTTATTTTNGSVVGRSRRGHVIDVAGGRGRMALELAIDRGIPCIVVDPVPVTFSVHTTRRIVNKAKDAMMDMTTKMMCACNNTSSSSSASISRTEEEEKEVTMEAMTTTTSLQTNEAEHIDNNNQNKPFILLNDKEFHRMDALVLQQTNAFMRNVVGFAYHQCLFNGDYIQQRPDVWKRASMVIGMHPDEATEIIVDQALLANKAFAVVPCCVFPNLFPWRTISISTTTTTAVPAASVVDDGIQQQQQEQLTATTTTTTPVRTLDQFILYLCAKDSRIQTHILDDMEGSNTVVYMKV